MILNVSETVETEKWTEKMKFQRRCLTLNAFTLKYMNIYIKLLFKKHFFYLLLFDFWETLSFLRSVLPWVLKNGVLLVTFTLFCVPALVLAPSQRQRPAAHVQLPEQHLPREGRHQVRESSPAPPVWLTGFHSNQNRSGKQRQIHVILEWRNDWINVGN